MQNDFPISPEIISDSVSESIPIAEPVIPEVSILSPETNNSTPGIEIPSTETETMFEEKPYMQGAEIMTPEGEQILRESIRKQVSRPVDLFDVAPGVSYSEVDRTYLGFSSIQQNESMIVNFDEAQATQWFKIAEEEVNVARQNGTPIVEINHEQWVSILEHEMDHFREGKNRGLDVTESTLGIAFGYSGAPEDAQRMIGVEWHVHHKDKAFQELNPIDEVSILLAPKIPSSGDCLKALYRLKASKDNILKRPKESATLIHKLLQTNGMGMIEFLKFLNS